MGKWTTMTRTLTNIDAESLKATYAISGSGTLGPISPISGTRNAGGRRRRKPYDVH